MRILKAFLATFLIFSVLAVGAVADNVWTSKPPLGSTIDWSNPLSQGLVGCWLMNEGGGNLVRSLTLVNDGTNNGCLWKPNIGGKGLFFNGSSNYVDLGNGTGWNLPFPQTFNVKNLTIICYVNPNIVSGTYSLVSHGANLWYFRINSSRLELLRSQQAVVATSTTNLIPNATQQLIFTGKNINTSSCDYAFYVNSKNNGSGNANFSITDNSYNKTVKIGAETQVNDSLSEYFSGQFIYLYVYFRVLSPSEIQSLYVAPYQFIKAPTAWSNFVAAGGEVVAQVTQAISAIGNGIAIGIGRGSR